MKPRDGMTEMMRRMINDYAFSDDDGGYHDDSEDSYNDCDDDFLMTVCFG